jgi:opacity protein-like surface antigen
MLKKIIAVAALALSVSSAFAADKPTFYAGVDAGSTKVDDLSGRKSSFGGFAGYQFTNGLAIEGGYRKLASFSVFVTDVDLMQSSVSLVGTSDIGNGFDVLARIGYNKLTASASYNGFSGKASDSGVLFGLGVAYNFTPSLSTRLEFQRPSKDSTNVSVGVALKF